MTLIPENLAIHKPNKILLEKMNSVDLEEKIIFQKETDFHSLTVVKNKIGKFIKYLDTYQAGFIKTKSYKGNIPYINYFLIPYLMNPDIKNVLVIGFGSGIVVNQYEKIFEKLKTIDIVDIEEYIFPLAQKYFNFQMSEKYNFYLQDAIVFLKTTKKKYDLIVVDVAGNDGLEERFIQEEYLNLVKSKLTKKGIFISNLPSSIDIFNKKNKIILGLIEKYKNIFNCVDLYDGSTSNKIFYKTFFDIDENVLDITNLIIISSLFKFEISKNYEKLNKIGVDIEKYLKDLI